MRDIKFRAWANNEMYYDWGIDSGLGEAFYMKIMQHITKETAKSNGYDLPNVSKWQKEIVLMQYTGLKDKNGKEIYEGDIVSKIGVVSEERFEIKKDYIEINTPQLGTVLIFTDILYDRKTGYKELFVKENANGVLSKTQNYEVIGNIYENPELLVED